MRKILLFIITFFILFTCIFAYFIYYFYNLPVKYYSTASAKGNILLLYGDIFNVASSEKLAEQFLLQQWNVDIAYLNSKAPVNFNKYTFVVAYFNNNIYDLFFSGYLSKVEYSQVPIFVYENNNHNYDVLSLKTSQISKISDVNVKNIEDTLIKLDELKITQVQQAFDTVKSQYSTYATLPNSLKINNVTVEKLTDNYFKICTNFYLDFTKHKYPNKFNTFPIHQRGDYCYLVSYIQNELVSIDPKLTVDAFRLADADKIHLAIQKYLTTNNFLPKSLDALNEIIKINTRDILTNKEYLYRINTISSYELCLDFYNAPSNFELKNGYYCRIINLENSNLTSTKSVNNGDFSEVKDGNLVSWVNNGSYIVADSVAVYPSSNTYLVSEAILVDGLFKYGIYVKNTDTCDNCGFIGLKLYDDKGNNLTFNNQNLNCGIYDSTIDSLITYIKPNTSNNLLISRHACNLPTNVRRVRILFGYTTAPTKAWEFDNVFVE